MVYLCSTQFSNNVATKKISQLQICFSGHWVFVFIAGKCPHSCGCNYIGGNSRDSMPHFNHGVAGYYYMCSAGNCFRGSQHGHRNIDRSGVARQPSAGGQSQGCSSGQCFAGGHRVGGGRCCNFWAQALELILPPPKKKRRMPPLEMACHKNKIESPGASPHTVGRFILCKFLGERHPKFQDFEPGSSKILALSLAKKRQFKAKNGQLTHLSKEI